MDRYEGREESVEQVVVGRMTVFCWRGPHTTDGGLEAARFDPATDVLTIFPRMPSGTVLKDQYSQVTELQVETDSLGRWDLESAVTENDSDGSLELQGLPDGFGRSLRGGWACGASTGA